MLSSSVHTDHAAVQISQCECRIQVGTFQDFKSHLMSSPFLSLLSGLMCDLPPPLLIQEGWSIILMAVDLLLRTLKRAIIDYHVILM